jgi:hypothetical protein
MASTPLDLPILISQLPNLQQIAGSHIIPQDAQQALFGQMVADQQHIKDQAVQEVEKKEKLEAVSQESGGKTSGGYSRQRRRQAQEAQPEPDTQSSNASPWTGNIINVKI